MSVARYCGFDRHMITIHGDPAGPLAEIGDRSVLRRVHIKVNGAYAGESAEPSGRSDDHPASAATVSENSYIDRCLEEIDRDLAESAKLRRASQELMAEQLEQLAKAAKCRRDYWWAPVVTALGNWADRLPSCAVRASSLPRRPLKRLRMHHGALRIKTGCAPTLFARH
jgi:hypothetical protein